MTNSSIKVAQCLAGAEFGGAENFYTRLVCALAAEPGLEQRAFTRANAFRVPQLEAAGVPVTTFRFGSTLNAIDNWRYRRALNHYHPDIVVTFMNRASDLTPPGDYLLLSRLGHYYKLKYYRHADYWIGITQGICNHMIRGGFPAERVFHIPNFADETPATPLPRDSFNTPVDQPLLIAAGRLHVNKGFDVLLRALPTIPDATLWLAGNGPEEQNLKALAEELDVAQRVRFLGWRSDVTDLMATGDLFVCPSRHEGLGSIVMESWAHRCPIVATDSQGPGEAIEHGVTGLLTPVDEVEPLAAAINELLQQPQLRARLVERALQHYRDHYSRQVIVNQYTSLYRELLARPRP